VHVLVLRSVRGFFEGRDILVHIYSSAIEKPVLKIPRESLGAQCYRTAVRYMFWYVVNHSNLQWAHSNK